MTTLGSAVASSGSVWDTRFLLYCLDNARSVGETIKTLDQWVAWSLLELQCGVFLDFDPFGRPYARHAEGRAGAIAGKFRAILTIHKGDEKYLQKVYAMTKSAVSHKVCFVCGATQDGPNMYSFYGPAAPHRNTLLNTEAFITTACGQQAWTRIPGWAPSVISYDWLHIVDLTIVPECAASAACL